MYLVQIDLQVDKLWDVQMKDTGILHDRVKIADTFQGPLYYNIIFVQIFS